MAAYTVLTETIIRNLLHSYDLGQLHTVEAMAGGQANSSALVSTERGTFVLSVCDEKSPAEIETLTATLEHLNRHGFRTSRLIKTKESCSFIHFEGKPVYMKEYIQGLVEQSLSADMLFQVGRALAELHQVPSPAALPGTFAYGIEKFEEVTALAGDYPEWLQAKKEQLEKCCRPELPLGFIHGDLFYDNIIVADGSIAALLDFEEACHYYLLFDLGMCAAGCCSREAKLSTELTASLIGGYQSVRALEEMERKLFQQHIVYAAAATSFWRYRQFNLIHPHEGKNAVYLEMMDLAEQVDDIPQEVFNEQVFGKS